MDRPGRLGRQVPEGARGKMHPASGQAAMSPGPLASHSIGLTAERVRITIIQASGTRVGLRLGRFSVSSRLYLGTLRSTTNDYFAPRPALWRADAGPKARLRVCRRS